MSSIIQNCFETAEFNYLFGVIDKPYNPSTGIYTDKFDKNNEIFDENQIKLRYNLIFEEYNELYKAIIDKDVVEIIDGICDLLYVVYGAKIYFNSSCEEINNKIVENIECSTTNTSIEELKTKHDDKYREHIQDTLKTINYIYYNMTKVGKLTDELINGNININEYDNSLDKIIFYVYKLASLLDINIPKYFRIVHESNMTKVCLTLEEAEQTVEKYKRENRDVFYTTKEFNDKLYYIIYDVNTKKILKSINYTKVKFD